jgi:hypothetical protein
LNPNGLRITALGFDDLDLGSAAGSVVNHDRRSLTDSSPIEKPFARCGATEERERGETETHVEVALIPGAKAAQSPAEPDCSPALRSGQPINQTFHLSTVLLLGNHSTTMQNKKLVQIIIWVIVLSMVLGLVVSVIAFL